MAEHPDVRQVDRPVAAGIDSRTPWVLREQISLLSGWAALWLAAALFVAVAGFVVVMAPTKLPNDVEGQLIYESSRIRRGLPLYFDPLVGVLDDGPLPIRKYVLYTPIWSALVSLVPSDWALVVGRGVAASCWFGGLIALAAWPARGHRRPILRPAALFAAFCAGSLFLLARSGLEAKPDTITALMTAWAFARTVRAKRVDAGAAVLFALATLTKPNMVGIAAGVFACDIVWRRRASAFPIAIAGGVVLVGAAVFSWVSHGLWLQHLHASAIMPVSAYRWWGYVRDYAPLLGVPHVVVAIFSASASRRARATPYGASGLGTSIAWASYTMGKHGSGTAYWLEPTMAMVVVLAHGEPFATSQRAQTQAAVFAPLLAVLVGAMSVPYFLAELARARRDPALVERLRVACKLADGEAVVASDTGLEMALSGRVTWAPWATSFLLRDGAFPLATIQGDYGRSALACFVDRGCDVVTPEPLPFDRGSEHSIFRFELRETVLANLHLAERIEGTCVFRRPKEP